MGVMGCGLLERASAWPWPVQEQVLEGRDNKHFNSSAFDWLLLMVF
jgi:hypothetical protein